MLRIGAVVLAALLGAGIVLLGPVYAGGSGPFGYIYVSGSQYGFWSGPRFRFGWIPPCVPLQAGDRVVVDIDAVLDQGSARVIAWRRSEVAAKDVMMGHHETVGEVVENGRSRLVFAAPQDGLYSFETRLSVGRLKPECRERMRENGGLLRHMFVPDGDCPTRAGSYTAAFRVDRRA